MNVEKIVMSSMGLLTMVGVVLGHQIHEYWLLLSLFTGFMLFQMPFTGLCPMAIILKKVCKIKTGSIFGK